MATLDNYERIKPLMKWDDPEKFYFIQIFKRRKDNPGMAKDMILINNHYIYTEEQFDKIYPEIKASCDGHNARAYLRLNRRSAKQTAMQSLKRLTEIIIQENFKAAKGAYASAAGEYHAEEDKTWIIDIDDCDLKCIPEDRLFIMDTILELQKATKKEPFAYMVKTRNGIHFIARPFNSAAFKTILQDHGFRCDLHKDNPTILYMP